MKHGGTVLSVAAAAAIAALIIWPAARIGNSLKKGEEAARLAYSGMRRMAINAISMPRDAADGTWIATAENAWRSEERLLAMVISQPGTGVLFAMPERSHYYLEPPSPESSPAYRFPSASVAKFSGAVSSGLVLDALFVTLRQRDVYLALRDAGIAALALILICAGWLIASSGTRQSAAGPEDYRSGTVTDSVYRAPEMPFAPPMDLDADGDLNGGLDVAPRPTLAAAETSRVAPAETPEGGHAAYIPLVGASARSSARIGEKDLPDGSLEGPKGLFDPLTGLGWESYLRERLSAELKRSASFEQDLCLLLAELDDSAKDSEDYAIFARTAQDFFSFKDLSFVFGDRGMAIILPNMDIDHAIRMSEELLKKLTFLIKGRSGAMSYLELFMGLSSRSGRLVDADRMVSEAVAALKKAREERDTHIMAFRPDPEKFRAYLASQ